MLRTWRRGCWFGALGAAAGLACGTDAVGVSECRTIERARCVAAAECGFPNVEECQRQQRDNCLHGVALETVDSIAVDACARDIERAGRCAAAEGPMTAASSCPEPVAAGDATATACDVVLSPERSVACAFLAPGQASAAAAAPAPPEPGDGGV